MEATMEESLGMKLQAETPVKPENTQSPDRIAG